MSWVELYINCQGSKLNVRVVLTFDILTCLLCICASLACSACRLHATWWNQNWIKYWRFGSDCNFCPMNAVCRHACMQVADCRCKLSKNFFHLFKNQKNQFLRQCGIRTLAQRWNRTVWWPVDARLLERNRTVGHWVLQYSKKKFYGILHSGCTVRI